MQFRTEAIKRTHRSCKMWPRAAVQAHKRCRNVLGEPGVRSRAEEEELETNPGAQGLNPSIRVRSDPAFLFPQQRGFPGPHLSLLSHFLMTISGLFPPPSLHFHCFFFFFFSGNASNAAASQQSHQPCGAASELRCSSVNPPYSTPGKPECLGVVFPRTIHAAAVSYP